MAHRDAGTEHPDSDVLNAFCEDALTPAERERMLVHLAACARCREVVALIAPAEGPPRVVPEHRQWWRQFPVLRWSAVAAAAAVVMAVALLHRPGALRYAPPAASTAASPEATRSERASAQAVPRAVPAPTEPATSSRNSAVDEGSGNSDLAEPVHQEAKKAAPAKSEMPPAADRQAEMAANEAASATGRNAQAFARFARPAPAPANPPASPLSKSLAVPAEAGAQQPSTPPSAVGGLVGGAAPQFAYRAGLAGAAHAAKVAGPSWSITPEGGLVHTAAGMAPQKVVVAGDVTFRAVAAVGNDVWTGGKGGVLYHSHDGGATWSLMAFPARQVIVAIAFDNPRDGIVTTEDGRKYVTHDAGQSWSRQ